MIFVQGAFSRLVSFRFSCPEIEFLILKMCNSAPTPPTFTARKGGGAPKLVARAKSRTLIHLRPSVDPQLSQLMHQSISSTNQPTKLVIQLPRMQLINDPPQPPKRHPLNGHPKLCDG